MLDLLNPTSRPLSSVQDDNGNNVYESKTKPLSPYGIESSTSYGQKSKSTVFLTIEKKTIKTDHNSSETKMVGV